MNDLVGQDDTSAWHGPLPQGYKTRKDYFAALLQSSSDQVLSLPLQTKWTPIMIWMTRHWIRHHHTHGDNIAWATFPTGRFLDAIGFASRGVGELDLFLRRKARNKVNHEFSKMSGAGLLDDSGCWTSKAESILSSDWNGYLGGLNVPLARQMLPSMVAADVPAGNLEATNTQAEVTVHDAVDEVKKDGHDKDLLLSLLADLRHKAGAQDTALANLKEQFANLKNQSRSLTSSTDTRRQRGQDMLQKLRLLSHDNRNLSAQNSQMRSLLVGALSSVPRRDLDHTPGTWPRTYVQKLLTSRIMVSAIQFFSKILVAFRWIVLLIIMTVVVYMVDFHRLIRVVHWSTSAAWVVSTRISLMVWWLFSVVVRMGYKAWT